MRSARSLYPACLNLEPNSQGYCRNGLSTAFLDQNLVARCRARSLESTPLNKYPFKRHSTQLLCEKGSLKFVNFCAYK